MPANFKISHYLMEGMLDGGLPFIGSYLERKIGRMVLITDAVGKINYPDMTDRSYPVEEMFVDIPEFNPDHEYYYSPDNSLYFYIKHQSIIAYVVVKNIPTHLVDDLVVTLNECVLPLKYYFALQKKGKEEFGQSLWENFFASAGASIPDKLKMYEQNMDINNYYFVCMVESDKPGAFLDSNRLRSCIYDNLQKAQLEYVASIIAPGRVVTIFPCSHPTGPQSLNPEWPGNKYINEIKRSINEKFDIKLSMGIGRAYRPSGLIKSFQEACVALALPRLGGREDFVQYFAQLGVFAVIFSHDADTIYDYCLQVLGKVIEHDQKNGTDLLHTLRILLDNACSWTTTANQLYVHVNTVYYRASKIEQLLGVDFSQFETRLHFYTAIRVWDTLQACSLLNRSEVEGKK